MPIPSKYREVSPCLLDHAQLVQQGQVILEHILKSGVGSSIFWVGLSLISLIYSGAIGNLRSNSSGECSILAQDKQSHKLSGITYFRDSSSQKERNGSRNPAWKERHLHPPSLNTMHDTPTEHPVGLLMPRQAHQKHTQVGSLYAQLRLITYP